MCSNHLPGHIKLLQLMTILNRINSSINNETLISQESIASLEPHHNAN